MGEWGDAEASTFSGGRYLPSAPLVSQVDADELDEGLVSMLGEKIGQALGNFRSSWQQNLKPEVALVLKLLIFRYGVLDPAVRASPAAKLQNLRLTSSRAGLLSSELPHLRKVDQSDFVAPRTKLLFYLLLHPPIFPTYVLTRLRQHALSRQWPDLPAHDWRRKAWKALVRVEDAARAWELLGWGWFLWDGRYPSLLMSILGLRLVPSSPHLTRLVSYEFMNRQLVWGAFTEFLMFAIPLLPPIPAFLAPATLFSPIKAFLSQPTSIDYTSLPAISASTKPGQPSSTPSNSTAAHSGPFAHLSKSTCPICHLRLTSSPVAIAPAGEAGASISLPRIGGTSLNSTHGDERDGEEDVKAETRIFVPAESDCQGRCRWCYYCIAEQLVRHREEVEARRKKGRGGYEENEEAWSCLRCGGGITRAWRVGEEDTRLEKRQG